MAWFKPKKVIIDCYTDNKILSDAYPISKAIKFAPSWWRALPPTYDQVINRIKLRASTAKKCPGFVDLYAKSWIVPAWSDILISTQSNGGYSYALPSGHIHGLAVVDHSREQFKGGFNDYIQAKLVSPWMLIDRNKTGIKFAFVQPSWSLLDDIKNVHVLPGLVDFAYNTEVNLNILLPKIDADYLIKAGTPLVHLLPITERQVEFNLQTISEAKYKELHYNHSPRSYGKF